LARSQHAEDDQSTDAAPTLEASAVSYEKPEITDHGDLADLTAGCIGTNEPDLMNPTDPEGFPDNSPAFGDPSFCE
jgi:hypothetical protein